MHRTPMSSLGLSSYHRAQALGDGAFGCVVSVFNDDGLQFASKSFGDDASDGEYDSDDDEENDGTLDLGLVREVSSLRLLMAPCFFHKNIMPLHDITVTGESDLISLIMPMYPMNIGKAIESKVITSRVEKIRVAHEAISALAYLHDNSIIHRDVKPDNIMMDANNSPILIDFSLCKVLAPMEEVSMETHTGNIGTACYISPECYNFEPYSYEADSYSIGVVLLELFQGELLTDTVGRDKAALVVVQKMVAELPANPFPDVLRKLLNSNGEERITCRAALSEPVFLKNNFAVPSVSRQFENALEWAHPSAREGDENLAPAPVGKKRGNGKVDAGKGGELGGQQQQLMARISAILGVERAQTLAAAKQYVLKTPSAEIQYCVMLAMKVYEESLTEFRDSERALKEAKTECDLDRYIEAEKEILKAMNYCLFVEIVEGGVEEAGGGKKGKKGKKAAKK